MLCQRRILRIRWFHRVTNAEVTSQAEKENLTSHIVLRVYVYEQDVRLKRNTTRVPGWTTWPGDSVVSKEVYNYFTFVIICNAMTHKSP